MPDGFKYRMQESLRKLSLAKILTRRKGKDLIDSALEDIVEMGIEWKKLDKIRQDKLKY